MGLHDVCVMYDTRSDLGSARCDGARTANMELGRPQQALRATAVRVPLPFASGVEEVAVVAHDRERDPRMATGILVQKVQEVHRVSSTCLSWKVE